MTVTAQNALLPTKLRHPAVGSSGMGGVREPADQAMHSDEHHQRHHEEPASFQAMVGAFGPLLLIFTQDSGHDNAAGVSQNRRGDSGGEQHDPHPLTVIE